MTSTGNGTTLGSLGLPFDGVSTCYNLITAKCIGKKVPMTEIGWRLFYGELVQGFGFVYGGIFEAIAVAVGASFNMYMFLNSLRCMSMNWFENNWHLAALFYYLMLWFEAQTYVQEQFDYFYPYVCSCKIEADLFVNSQFGGDKVSNFFMSSCSTSTLLYSLNNPI